LTLNRSGSLPAVDDVLVRIESLQGFEAFGEVAGMGVEIGAA
jgi:hypothetical protein